MADYENQNLQPKSLIFLNNIPKDSTLVPNYNANAIVSILSRLDAMDASISIINDTLSRVVGDISRIGDFLNDIHNNKELLYVMMRNSIQFYNEVEEKLKSSGVFNSKFEFSTVEDVCGGHEYKLEILEVVNNTNSYKISRFINGIWELDLSSDFVAITLNNMILEQAIANGYKTGDVVYINCRLVDSTNK